jgi:hypothetical protein
MDVIGHDDEGMKLETISGSLFLQNFDEERCVLVDLEEATAGGCGAGYEERP